MERLTRLYERFVSRLLCSEHPLICIAQWWGTSLTPSQIFKPIVEKGDFCIEFDGKHYAEFYFVWNPFELENFLAFGHCSVIFQWIGLNVCHYMTPYHVCTPTSNPDKRTPRGQVRFCKRMRCGRLSWILFNLISCGTWKISNNSSFLYQLILKFQYI